MSKFKCRKNDEARMTNGSRSISLRHWSFGFRSSFEFRLSTFLQRTYKNSFELNNTKHTSAGADRPYTSRKARAMRAFVVGSLLVTSTAKAIARSKANSLLNSANTWGVTVVSSRRSQEVSLPGRLKTSRIG